MLHVAKKCIYLFFRIHVAGWRRHLFSPKHHPKSNVFLKFHAFYIQFLHFLYRQGNLHGISYSFVIDRHSQFTSQVEYVFGCTIPNTINVVFDVHHTQHCQLAFDIFGQVLFATYSLQLTFHHFVPVST